MKKARSLKDMPIVVIFVTLIWIGLGCQPKQVDRHLELVNLQQLDSGSFTFEEKKGTIWVTVIDKFNDAHIHNLNYAGYTREQVTDILKKKQKDLQEKGLK
jgi:hypothetical protein